MGIKKNQEIKIDCISFFFKEITVGYNPRGN